MITGLFESGVTEEQVCRRTGHRSMDSLKSYHQPSAKMKLKQTENLVNKLNQAEDKIVDSTGHRRDMSNEPKAYGKVKMDVVNNCGRKDSGVHSVVSMLGKRQRDMDIGGNISVKSLLFRQQSLISENYHLTAKCLEKI